MSDLSDLKKHWPGAIDRGYLKNRTMLRRVGGKWIFPLSVAQGILVGLSKIRGWYMNRFYGPGWDSGHLPRTYVTYQLANLPSALTVLIESGRPQSVARAGVGTYVIQWQEDDGLGQWEGAEDPPRSLRERAVHAMQLHYYGPPPGDICVRLAQDFVQDLHDERAQIPGFTPERTDNALLLHYKRR